MLLTNQRTFSTQNTKISARSLAISYICFQVHCNKRRREIKKAILRKFWWLPHPRPPTRAPYAKLQLEKLQFLSLLTTIFGMPLFAENSRASGGSAPWAPGRSSAPAPPPGPVRRPLDPTRMRRIACFRHTHTHTIGLLAIIYNSFFSSFWSVCKTFFRRKSTKFLARSRPLARSFFQVSCVLVSIINKTISRVLRTQSWTYCTDKQWFINNAYIEIWEELYVFNADIYKKIGSLASLARNFVYIFSTFQRVVIQ